MRRSSRTTVTLEARRHPDPAVVLEQRHRLELELLGAEESAREREREGPPAGWALERAVLELAGQERGAAAGACVSVGEQRAGDVRYQQARRDGLEPSGLRARLQFDPGRSPAGHREQP